MCDNFCGVVWFMSTWWLWIRYITFVIFDKSMPFSLMLILYPPPILFVWFNFNFLHIWRKIKRKIIRKIQQLQQKGMIIESHCEINKNLIIKNFIVVFVFCSQFPPNRHFSIFYFGNVPRGNLLVIIDHMCVKVLI